MKTQQNPKRPRLRNFDFGFMKRDLLDNSSLESLLEKYKLLISDEEKDILKDLLSFNLTSGPVKVAAEEKFSKDSYPCTKTRSFIEESNDSSIKQPLLFRANVQKSEKFEHPEENSEQQTGLVTTMCRKLFQCF